MVLVFFLPTCPHCHAMLKYLDALAKQLDNQDLAIVPVSVDDKKYVIEEMVERPQDLARPLHRPHASKAQKAYGFQQTVPEVFVIDRQGRVVQAHRGRRPRAQDRDACSAWRSSASSASTNPILLRKTAYSGEESCSVCHREQHATWELTTHASAWETLVEHGADRDPECLKCHTVGFGKPGGFDLEKRQPELRGVQCENCHGRGGPHQSPEFAKAGFEPICLHLPRPAALAAVLVRRAPAAGLARREPAVREALGRRAQGAAREARQARAQALRAERLRRLGGLPELPREGARAVGGVRRTRTRSRRSRRRARRRTPTASAATRPASRRRPASRPAAPRSRTWAARAATVRASATSTIRRTAPGTILALTDKCDSCAITLICGKCHDDANDPGFEFEIEPKLAKIKHGFRPKPTAAK